MPIHPVFVMMDKYGRLRFPADFAKALPWLGTASQITAWLYVIDPGRYRLLSEADAERSPAIRGAIQRMDGAVHPDRDEDPFLAEGAELAAVGALLVRVTLSSSQRVGWRVQIPRHSFPIASLAGGRGFYLLFSEGYLELWTEEVLTRALRAASDVVEQ